MTDTFLYRDVAERLRAQIDAGVFAPGERLPSVRALMRQHGISLSTANGAVAWLEQHGYLLARPRSGCFVHPKFHARLREPEPTRTAAVRAPAGIARLAAEVNLAAQDPSLVPLGAAVVHPSLLPMRELGQALADVARRRRVECGRYMLPPGHPQLRRQIAVLSRERGCELSADDVVVTAGDTDALELALRATTRPGDRVAIESPTYFGIVQLIEALGLQALEIATHPRTGLDVDELMRAAASTRIAAVVMNPNFHNPFGCCMPEDEKRRLVDWLHARRLPLVEDDVFGDLHFGERRPPSCKAFDREGWVLACSSFSKTLAPGLRVGWCVPGRFREQVVELQFARALAVNAPVQLAMADYLGGREHARHQKALRTRFAQQKALVRSTLARVLPATARVTDPEGGFVFWVELPPGSDGTAVYEAALQAGISLAPGRMFSAGGGFDHCVRVAVGLPWSTKVEAALGTVGRIVRHADPRSDLVPATP